MCDKIISPISWIDNYMQLLLRSIEQNNQGKWWSYSNNFSFGTSKESKNCCIKFSIPYANEVITWKTSFNPLYPELGPDLILEQDEYLQYNDVQYLKKNLSSLIHWNLTSNLSLLKTIEELIVLYKNYQLKMLKKNSKILADDIDMLLVTMPLENLEIFTRPKQTETRFLIKINLDVLKHDNQRYIKDWDFLLIFSCYGTMYSNATLELCLSPSLENLSDELDLEHLPVFQFGDQGFKDYVFDVTKFISEKVDNSISHLEKRKEFIISVLILQYATLLEYDVISYRKVSLLLEHSNVHYILTFLLPLNFPNEQFSISLYSVYHMTEQGIPISKNIQNFPYCPRWHFKHMIFKALEYITTKEVSFFESI